MTEKVYDQREGLRECPYCETLITRPCRNFEEASVCHSGAQQSRQKLSPVIPVAYVSGGIVQVGANTSLRDPLSGIVYVGENTWKTLTKASGETK